MRADGGKKIPNILITLFMYANFLLSVVCYAHSNYPYLILYYISNILIMLYDDMSAEAYRSLYYNIINNAV